MAVRPRVQTCVHAQAFIPCLLCLASAIVEADSARRRQRGGLGMIASHPALDRMDGPLRATYALAWAAGHLLHSPLSSSTEHTAKIELCYCV